MNGADRAAEQRRAAFADEVRATTAIDEAMIERLVREFYARARRDALLGPIFEARVDDWEAHIAQICGFWSSVALMTGRYHGRPMQKHAPLPIDGRHFDRWLALFEATARDLCPAEAASHFTVLARRVAESLELGVATSKGVLLGKGERLRPAASGTGR